MYNLQSMRARLVRGPYDWIKMMTFVAKNFKEKVTIFNELARMK